jgi:hypothetical protein
VRGAACRGETGGGAAAGRRSLALAGRRAAVLDRARPNRDPPATFGDARFAADRLLETADDRLREEVAAALRGYEDTVLECLMPALRSAAARHAAGLDEIVRDCTRRLAAIVAQPQRKADDWSIAWTGCRCDLCDTLGTFLVSQTRQVLEWPLATNGRQHLHTQIDSAGLPVRHQTRRQGRPYTLVLTKTNELFTRATTARHTAETDLAWLTSTWGDIERKVPQRKRRAPR